MSKSSEKRREYNRKYYLKRKRLAHKEAERKLPLTVRIPASLHARIHRLTIEAVATGKWPYKTNSDTATDLFIRGLSSLKGDETIDEMLPYLEMSQQFAAREAHRNEMRALFAKVRTEINELLGVGAQKHALNLYGGSMESIEKMTLGVWRDWLMKELQTAFPEMEKYYRKGGKLPVEVQFARPKRRYKLTKSDDDDSRPTFPEDR